MYSAFVSKLVTDLGLIKPELALLAVFIIVIIADIIFKNNKLNAGISIIGSVITAFLLIEQSSVSASVFSGLLVIDPFAVMFKFIIILSTVILFVMAWFSEELHKSNIWLGEYYMLVFGMALGMFLLAGASNLIMIYLAIETMSMSSYILAGYTKQIKRSNEASLKYVIFGSISSGIMIYGISIMFGLTGSFNLSEINTFLLSSHVNQTALLVSGLMILSGFAYKISAVPFHFWAPDVYEGSPITITAYLSVASKAAGFAILIRFFKITFFDPYMSQTDIWALTSGIRWDYVIAILSILTMTVGNFVAVWQNNVKRMLAYSSIAHAGYLLMAVVVMTNFGIMSIMVYFLFYLLMNFAAFLLVMLFAHKIGSENLDDYVGLGYKAPFLATLLSIVLVSLIGLPSTAGFIGKLYLFTAVLDQRWYWLALIGVLNSVVSLYYYAKVIRNMWLRGIDNENTEIKFPISVQIFAVVLTAPLVYFGFFFTPIVHWAENSVRLFMGH
jgi:NADH-quinone oxidoreductase subunit N